jgi:dTDP-4-dehydrorhamnose 3,5-epimerase
MRCDDPGFAGFAEVYFSFINTGFIKGWKLHKRMTMNLVVPVGSVRFVFYNPMKSGNTKFSTEEIGESRYVRITVPPGIWFAFQGCGVGSSLVMNFADIVHTPDESDRLDLEEIAYVWGNN